MYLMQDPNWKAVHFTDRTLLPKDRILYPQAQWEYLVNKLEVVPMSTPGHYRVLNSGEVAGK